MTTVHTIAELREALAGPRRAGATIGLVPTMGSLHEGHLSLIRRAHDTCAVVVVSVFVNPAQFDDAGDLAAYPQDLGTDAALAASAGADLLFAPSAEEMYPAGFATGVRVGGVSEPLEGAHRGAVHFDGVATVVTKLLNIAGPDVAFFGQKDAQQALVIRRLVRDLDMPVRIEVAPTLRDADGLALSSRNARLDDDGRSRALALSRALRAAAALVAGGERDAARILEVARAVIGEAALEPDYLSLVSTETLEPVDTLDDEALLVVAARVGDVRLIDNATLSPVPARSPA